MENVEIVKKDELMNEEKLTDEEAANEEKIVNEDELINEDDSMGKDQLIHYLVSNLDECKQRLRDKIQLYRSAQNMEIINPVSMGYYYGFKLFQSDLDIYEGLQGFCVLKKQQPISKVIYVSKSLSEQQKRETYAHEVMHLLMLPDDIEIDSDIILDRYENGEVVYDNHQARIEAVCNEYMRDILMPEREFLEEYKLAFEMIQDYVTHLATRFGVQNESVETRILELRLRKR